MSHMSLAYTAYWIISCINTMHIIEFSKKIADLNFYLHAIKCNLTKWLKNLFEVFMS